MIEIRDDSVVVGVEMLGEEIAELKSVLSENADTLKKVVVVGDIENLGSTMLLQLLVALKKSRPKIIVEPIDSGEISTPQWGHWKII